VHYKCRTGQVGGITAGQFVNEWTEAPTAASGGVAALRAISLIPDTIDISAFSVVPEGLVSSCYVGADFTGMMAGHIAVAGAYSNATPTQRYTMMTIDEGVATHSILGSTYDAHLCMSSAGGAGARDMILINNCFGNFPVAAGGISNILKIRGGTPSFTDGIDISSATFSGSAFKSPNFTVAGTGAVNVSGGTTGAAPTPRITFGSYYDDAGNASVSHIDLFGGSGQYGFGVSAGAVNYVSVQDHKFYDSDALAAPILTVNSTATYSPVLISTSFMVPNLIFANGVFGTAGQVLKMDGTKVYWDTNTPVAAGADKEIQFNDAGATGANAEFRFDKTSKTLHIGNTTANLLANSILVSVSNATGIANLQPTQLIIGGSTVNSTAHVAGANAFLSTTTLSVGNTTANLLANSILVSVSNATGIANLEPSQLVIGATVVNSTFTTAGKYTGNTVLKKTTVYVANGTHTVQANLVYAEIITVAAGGGSGSANAANATSSSQGGGGGGGSTTIKTLTKAQLNRAQEPVIVGIGGFGANATTAATIGSNSIFGNSTSTFTQLISVGGGAGTNAVVYNATASVPGGAGGAAGTGGDLHFPGGDGDLGGFYQGNTTVHTTRGVRGAAGQGGQSGFNYGSSAKANTAGKLYGGGAGGAWQNTNVLVVGQNGGNGVVVVYEFYNGA
jgi:hypothetical protein